MSVWVLPTASRSCGRGRDHGDTAVPPAPKPGANGSAVGGTAWVPGLCENVPVGDVLWQHCWHPNKRGDHPSAFAVAPSRQGFVSARFRGAGGCSLWDIWLWSHQAGWWRTRHLPAPSLPAPSSPFHWQREVPVPWSRKYPEF